MSKNNGWMIRSASTIALLSLAACANGGGGGGGGGPSTPSSCAAECSGGGGGGDPPPPPPSFAVANPYANYTDTAPTKLGTLTVFGDSYSDPTDPKRAPVTFWSEMLVDRAGGATLDSYARGEASANDVNVYYEPGNGEDPNNTFKNQVDRWLATGPNPQANDLTVVYLGYNDVNKLNQTNGTLQGAFDNYTREVDRLMANGAGTGDGKVFVTLIHDWGSTPNERAKTLVRCGEVVDDTCNFKRDRTKFWNRHVVDFANSNDDVVAVDLFTVFDRVIANPGQYGLTNVTTADATASGVDALYFDPNHFGNRGQDIVAQVYNHYLTRAWDWANTLQAGTEATAQLNQDLDAGLARSLAALAPDQRLGLNSFAFGSNPTLGLAEQQGSERGDPSRAGFETMRLSQEGTQGFGLNYGLTPDTMLGVAFGQQLTSTSNDANNLYGDFTRDSQTTSIYLDTEMLGLTSRSKFSYSDDSHTRREYDSLVDANNSSNFDGQTMSFSQGFAKSLRAGSAWVTPWVDLTWTRQEIDGYTLSNPYVTDVRYSGATAEDTTLGLGFDAQLDPIALTREANLRLSGGLSWTTTVHQNDLEVTMREQTGAVQTETLEREGVQTLQGRLAAVVDLSEQVSLDASYTVTNDQAAGLDQAVLLGVNWAF